MTRVGFDLDGVVYRFTKAYHSWMNQSKGLSLNVELEAQTWNWFLDWQTVEEFLEDMHNSVDAGQLFWQGELYETSIPQNFADIKSAGHTIHVITHRFSGKLRSAEDATMQFLQQNSLYYDTITFSKDKTCVPTDVFIEDNLNNYDALAACGVEVYLINRPYNLLNDTRRRVNSVDEYTKLLLSR